MSTLSSSSSGSVKMKFFLDASLALPLKSMVHASILGFHLGFFVLTSTKSPLLFCQAVCMLPLPSQPPPGLGTTMRMAFGTLPRTFVSY
eukprot:CAMPEP_0197559518 /NCGR_PEP_ID=MMETSP1320-20131121/21400_1 /TAXON_ID=91990 /ORGANISM="Bolidomonas sp., Strain RCC2347" /LENGTH=88 /DNA_ID=CAMNT_0043120965 /DNA_START=119 /DNA_END=382 /DNA_ORIENTATION=-